MKRLIALLLLFSFLLCGCSFLGERIKTPVTFYYLCSRYPQDLCCVILPETREASGHSGDLSYLLALYRMGPADEELVSPLGAGIGINAMKTGEHIFLELSDPENTLSEIQFSLACACLSLTCLEITNAADVTIRCGDRIKTLDAAGIILNDTAYETTSLEESE